MQRNRYFYGEDQRFMRFLIPEGLRVLELGCGTGDLLAALKPKQGVGIDFSPNILRIAHDRYPDFTFIEGDIEDPNTYTQLSGPFDVIVISDTLGYLDNCDGMFNQLHRLCERDTRLVIAHYNPLWQPLFFLAETLGLKMPQVHQNWLTMRDIENLLMLADFQVIRREWWQLIPRRLLGLGGLINRFIGTLPLIRHACVRNYTIVRSMHCAGFEAPLSATVLIPCRNEKGNIEAAIQRLPQFCDDLEILFVEGGSQDGTLEEIHRVIAAYPERDVKVLVQDGKGKGDAVRKGFAHAQGEVLIILDADLTVPPEVMPKFYQAICTGKGELINGSRLVYPMDDDAMRFLNSVANEVFSWIFTWLLNQRFTDTLCGTKVLTQHHYQQIVRNRAYFGDFDPFGDFDLIFGASKLNLKVCEIPVQYAGRSYGETQISRFRHGWLLLRMVVFAFRKLKVIT